MQIVKESNYASKLNNEMNYAMHYAWNKKSEKLVCMKCQMK